MYFFVTLVITVAAVAGAFQYSISCERRRRNVSGLRRNCGSDVYAVDSTTISLALQPCFQYVAKTTESFKFADLYWLQANVMAYSENPESVVEKLAFHRPTASLLLGYNRTTSSGSDQQLPFPSDRVQYVGRIIASGVNAQELLANIRETTSTCNCLWTLEYDTFEPLAGRQFTTSMLMCAISRLLSGEPLLGRNDSDDATIISYLLVESSSKLYLVEKLTVDNQMHEMYDDDVKRFRQKWSRRPFQYSGAVNIEIAITVVDMLHRLLQKNGDDLKDNRRIRVLDPTVGSGTFLAAAATLWNSRGRDDENWSLEVVGIDSNSKCSEGTIQNLRKLLGVECIAEGEGESNAKSWDFINSKSEIDSRATIYCGDSVELISSKLLGDEFDCVVSNLPWNRNTYEYKEDTCSCTRSEIMRRLPKVLKPGKPVIVVSGGSDDSFNAKCCLQSIGFSVIGEVSIPPAGFSLPCSRKKKSIEATDQSAKRNSDCMITIAIAPKH
ncbi:hypothetical protein ACHAXM_007443 [Skeletonema potamos]|jgi:hypothetical protein